MGSSESKVEVPKPFVTDHAFVGPMLRFVEADPQRDMWICSALILTQLAAQPILQCENSAVQIGDVRDSSGCNRQ
jgi:hypothetical protein